MTPARAASQTLPRTLDSVARQSVRDWQHILVTHPEDLQTGAVAALHAAQDSRIVHLQADSPSAGAARNAGLAVARGAFVLFLDADDTIRARHLHHLLRQSRRTGAQVSMAGHRRLSFQGRTIQHRPGRAGPVEPATIGRGPPAALHAMLFRHDLLRRIGPFDPALQTNEDWDLCLRAAAGGATFHSSPACLADYWIGQGTLSGNAGAMVRDRIAVRRRAVRLGIDEARGLNMEENMQQLGEDALGTALWAGAMAVARRQDVAPILREIEALTPFPPLTLDTPDGAAALLDGLLVGFACRAEDVEAHWAGVAVELEVFLSAVAGLCEDPGFDRALIRALELELARIGPAGTARRIGRTQVVPALAMSARRIVVVSGAEQVVLRFPLRPRSWATVPFAPEVAHGRSARSLALGRAAAWIGERPRSANAPLARLRDMAVRLAIRARRVIGHRAPVQAEPNQDPHATGAWEEIFSTENPWHYTRDYEQTKYQRTLDLLPPGPIGRALELACAEGHFTAQLAGRVGHLTASDISATALDRCRQRCEAAGLHNLSYLELDFFDRPFGSGWDLIVSSEVLYYMGSAGKLADYARRVADALADGGLFLHAHAYEISDTPQRTGFDWGDEFAAGTISAAFSACDGLVLEQAVDTELYRIELYRKRVDRGDLAHRPAAVAQRMSTIDQLEPELAADVVWNGAVVSRSAAETERCTRLPVLMYHSIADSGPDGLSPWRTSPADFEHQLRFLRRRGYRSVSIAEWDDARARNGAIAGRPVLITFDDGLADFAEQAWPILRRNGFDALMFVVTGSVGGTSEWDRWYGAPAPLMDWDSLARLAGEGLEIGSHGHVHRPFDRMDSAQILADARQSRDVLGQRLGVAPTAFAPPFGIYGPHHGELLRQAGYDRLFAADGSLAPVAGPRMRTPRIAVPGGIGIDGFARLVGAVNGPEDADRP